MRISTVFGSAALVAALCLIGCSEMQVPAMDQAQADVYNHCMGSHWSTLADSALFGFAGYEYHQNQVLNCQQVALTPRNPASSDQPVKSASVPVAVTAATPAAPATATANPGLPIGAGSPGNEWQPAQ